MDKHSGGLYTVQGKQEGVSKLPWKLMESLSWFLKNKNLSGAQGRKALKAGVSVIVDT